MATSTSVLDQIRLTVETDEDTDEDDGRLVPALDKLNRDQKAFIRSWVQDGYRSRRELILSLSQLQTYTLGRVPDGWYRAVATENVPLSVLITSEQRKAYRHDPIDLDAAKEERRLWAAKYLRPACRAAFRELRREAQQYTNEDERVNDPDEQSHPAMRPVMGELYRTQTEALLSLLDGFDDHDDVDEWLADLDRAHLGELAKVKPDFDWEVYQSTTADRVFTSDAYKYKQERMQWAAAYLLPAFNKAVSVLARHADEHREDDNDVQDLEKSQL